MLLKYDNLLDNHVVSKEVAQIKCMYYEEDARCTIIEFEGEILDIVLPQTQSEHNNFVESFYRVAQNKNIVSLIGLAFDENILDDFLEYEDEDYYEFSNIDSMHNFMKEERRMYPDSYGFI